MKNFLYQGWQAIHPIAYNLAAGDFDGDLENIPSVYLEAGANLVFLFLRNSGCTQILPSFHSKTMNFVNLYIPSCADAPLQKEPRLLKDSLPQIKSIEKFFQQRHHAVSSKLLDAIKTAVGSSFFRVTIFQYCELELPKFAPQMV